MTMTSSPLPIRLLQITEREETDNSKEEQIDIPDVSDDDK